MTNKLIGEQTAREPDVVEEIEILAEGLPSHRVHHLLLHAPAETLSRFHRKLLVERSMTTATLLP